MKTLRMTELKAVSDRRSPEELILDVRTPEEFQEGHVPGARNVPHTEVDQHLEMIRKFKTVYVYCKAGARATHAAVALARSGITDLVCVQSGGMPDWNAAALPTET